MKVLLVNPYFNSRVYAPTLGLGFLATYIKNHSQCEIEIAEPVKKELNKKILLEKIKKTDFLGLTCYTESRFQCFEFAKMAKEINPKCQIIVGGPHVTALDEQVLQHYPWIDMVVRSEGEESILEIVKGRSPRDIKGITWRQGAEIIRNPDRCLEKK
ncbi:MAG: B12-binding domain-containing radical SAM protein [Patescibacteria group bacterium]